MEKKFITVSASINAPLQTVWCMRTEPKHIVNWNFASDDWHSPKAEIELRVGGKFCVAMAAKDGSFAFDFSGTYTKVEYYKGFDYTMDDGRTSSVVFTEKNGATIMSETFEAEGTNPVEMQEQGWQSILNNFKKYVEANKNLKLHFNVLINASAEKTFSTMLNKEGYEAWTKAFNPTSHFKGNWSQGSKILFIGQDENGNVGGMVSRIRQNIKNQHLSIEHLGMVQGDKEIMDGPAVEPWKGGLENYTFINEANGTRVYVDMDSNEDFKSYFEETWPKALSLLKEICER